MFDPKLIELVARALALSDGWTEADWTYASNAPIQFMRFKERAVAALTAINDSGEWWVAPADASASMREAGVNAATRAWINGEWGQALQCYRAMRTAHLSRTEETK